jgi:hypothetical protein
MSILLRTSNTFSNSWFRIASETQARFFHNFPKCPCGNSPSSHSIPIIALCRVLFTVISLKNISDLFPTDPTIEILTGWLDIVQKAKKKLFIVAKQPSSLCINDSLSSERKCRSQQLFNKNDFFPLVVASFHYINNVMDTFVSENVATYPNHQCPIIDFFWSLDKHESLYTIIQYTS